MKSTEKVRTHVPLQQNMRPKCRVGHVLSQSNAFKRYSNVRGLLLRTGHQIISSIADDNIKALSWSDEWGNDMLTEKNYFSSDIHVGNMVRQVI